jgi:hypothetical protein
VRPSRIGVHICYYGGLRNMKALCPSWSINKTLPRILEEMVRDKPAAANWLNTNRKAHSICWSTETVAVPHRFCPAPAACIQSRR